MDPTDIAAKVVPKIAEKVYDDAVSNTMIEVSKIGVDAVKVFRLVLFPLQYAAMWQDRLAKQLAEAIDKVPESRRIAPLESMALPIADKLRYQEEGSTLCKLYLNLLSRSLDRDRVGEAHPAFLNIISQLAPDEVVILEQLSEAECKVYFRTKEPINPRVLTKAESDLEINSVSLADTQTKTEFKKMGMKPEELGQPSLFSTFLEHLVSLGLVSYTNEPFLTQQGLKHGGAIDKQMAVNYHFIKLNGFGQLFHTACISDD